ncbi:hypothetical protein GN543_004229 [Salmonella enterica]|nr:hypothetical protein [Salmonella enterica]EDL0220568.1 hypothetical protein [Salmonella enterica subsp. diarizonae]EIE2749994.1 hypothetical protein [Salmonella enterica subsp. diarizonae serovar 48:i:z]ECR4178196.1 hypothetical protein [Salmonella enterica]EDZ0944916.1 hypothetical protein [Salmonella enterica]
MNPEQIEFNKFLSQHQKDASIKACLRVSDDKIKCSGKIIHAHSIQRGKILESIADVGGENEGKVYHLGFTPADDMQSMQPEFKLQGIKKFSTFTGFCSGHDKAIFQPIEDVAFSATTKQLNIYAYRAVAKELHSNLESKNFYEVLLGDKLNVDDFPPHFQLTLPLIKSGKNAVPDYILEAMLQGEKNHQIRVRHKQCGHNISELKQICDDLTDAIEREESLGFEHIYHVLDGAFLVACCASFIPYFDHDGNRIISKLEEQQMAQSSVASNADMKNVMLNVFPEGGKTHVIFTFSKGNQSFKSSIGRLLKLEDEALKIGLSNIVLNYVENSAYGPKYINDNFSPEQVKQIADVFAVSACDRSKFRRTDINLFVGRPTAEA